MLQLHCCEDNREVPQLLQELEQESGRRRQLEAALRVSERRRAMASQLVEGGLWEWDLRTNRMHFPPQWAAIVGCAASEIGDRPEEWFDRVHPEDLPGLKQVLERYLQDTPGGASLPIQTFEYEHRMRHSDGKYRWVRNRGTVLREASDEPQMIIGYQMDITRQKEAEEQLRYTTLYDPLTGLPNRSLFLEYLAQAFGRMERRDDYLFAVLFFDLDRFKHVNESLGHASGDQVLVTFAQRLEESLRSNDVVGYLGGDEFVVLLDDIRDISDANRVAERIREQMQMPFYVDEQEVFTTTSIGIAFSTTDYAEPEDIVRDAHTAMYRAKSLGRDRYEMFDAAMHQRAVERLRLEAELRKAVEEKQLMLHYQPIIDLTSAQIHSVEALVRWCHPEQGFVSPTEFIPLAEETGLIIPLGEWVLETACRQVNIWRQNGCPNLQVTVNISAHQLLHDNPQHPDLVGFIRQLLTETQLSPEALMLEITESQAMNDINLSIRVLGALERLGVQTAIDDFGTGYSSLAYLKRLPIQTIKIDRSFVCDVPDDSDDVAIIRAILAMSHSLNLSVVAEGVETPEQFSFLQGQKCEQAQGYLFSKPMPADKVTEMFLTQGEWCPIIP